MRARVTAWFPWIVSWALVLLVATATTAGFVSRFLTPDDAPYPLMTRDAGDHPLATAGFFVASFVVLAVVFLTLTRVLARWRDGVSSTPATGPRSSRVMALVEWTFARWWRVTLALFVVWLPFYATSFPGVPSPDGANMLTEWLSTRSDFAGAPLFATEDETSPLLEYPTATYLLTDSDRLWSNHHPFFLVAIFGSICSVSDHVFGSIIPGIAVISALSAIVTLVAFGRALWLIGRHVTSWRHRLAGFLVVATTPLIALWSMAIHKNQLFAAGLVWVIGLLAELVHSRAPLRRSWYVETFAASAVVAMSVQFGWILLMAQAAALLLMKGRRLAGLVSLALPALLVTGSISLLVSSGTISPTDPVEAKGLQLQTLALILVEHPDALTAQEREQLSAALDLDAVVVTFNPWTSDRAKSKGALVTKTGSYRYMTVQPGDWDHLNSIVLRAALDHPGTTLDSLFLKSYRYLDPFDEGTDWYAPWRQRYERHINGEQIAPISFNAVPRQAVRDVSLGCFGQAWCRPFVSHSTKTVFLVLLFAAAIAVRRRLAWFWALPILLQLAIAGASPLSAGGRYTLGITYAVGLMVLLLMVGDRRPDDEPSAETTDGTTDGTTDDHVVPVVAASPR